MLDSAHVESSCAPGGTPAGMKTGRRASSIGVRRLGPQSAGAYPSPLGRTPVRWGVPQSAGATALVSSARTMRECLPRATVPMGVFREVVTCAGRTPAGVYVACCRSISCSSRGYSQRRAPPGPAQGTRARDGRTGKGRPSIGAPLFRRCRGTWGTAAPEGGADLRQCPVGRVPVLRNPPHGAGHQGTGSVTPPSRSWRGCGAGRRRRRAGRRCGRPGAAAGSRPRPGSGTGRSRGSR